MFSANVCHCLNLFFLHYECLLCCVPTSQLLSTDSGVIMRVALADKSSALSGMEGSTPAQKHKNIIILLLHDIIYSVKQMAEGPHTVCCCGLLGSFLPLG